MSRIQPPHSELTAPYWQGCRESELRLQGGVVIHRAPFMSHYTFLRVAGENGLVRNSLTVSLVGCQRTATVKAQ